MSNIDKTSEYIMTDFFGKMNMFIGETDYELVCKVSDDFKGQLPTIEQIEAELTNMEKETGQ